MIGAQGRGAMAGYQAARLDPFSDLLDDEEISRVARRVLASLCEQGFAHLEPGHEFVRSFVENYRIAVVVECCSSHERYQEGP